MDRPVQTTQHTITSLSGETNSVVHEASYVQDRNGHRPTQPVSSTQAGHQGGVAGLEWIGRTSGAAQQAQSDVPVQAGPPSRAAPQRDCEGPVCI